MSNAVHGLRHNSLTGCHHGRLYSQGPCEATLPGPSQPLLLLFCCFHAGASRPGLQREVLPGYGICTSPSSSTVLPSSVCEHCQGLVGSSGAEQREVFGCWSHLITRKGPFVRRGLGERGSWLGGEKGGGGVL